MHDKLIEIAHKLGAAEASGVDTSEALDHVKELACYDYPGGDEEDEGDGEDDE